MLFPMYIDGKWYEGNGKKRDVISPVTGNKLGQIPLGNKGDVDKALQAAHKKTKIMESMTVFERAKILNQIADVTKENSEKLAKLLCEEHGKHITEAFSELESTVASF